MHMQGGLLILYWLLVAVVFCSCTATDQYCDAETGGCVNNFGVLSEESSKLLESSIWSDNEQIREVFPLLMEVQAIADEIDLILSPSDLDLKDTFSRIEMDLQRIFHRLHNGTLEVGIVGLQKAGKSTFLNALLGKKFLPSSVESQTATEVLIVHDESKSNGSLYCATGEEVVPLAEGETEIYDELMNRNKEARSKIEFELVNCDKLILRAPIIFLMKGNIQDIKVQFADTPGFGEAGKTNVAKSVRFAVKKMSAFILVLNSEYMGSVSEAHLLKNLTLSHPDLFSKLNRVLILVNGREGIYRAGSSSNSKSVTPKGIPEYVSGYLQTEEFLDLKNELSPDKVILFNALWALNCRQQNTWLNLPENETKTIFLEAKLMLMYNKIHYQEENVKSIDAKDIGTLCDLLEPISAIEDVERRIWQMVIENGPKILLESVIDDTIGIIKEDFIPALDYLIGNQNVARKGAIVRALETLNSLIEDLLKEGKSEFDSISTSGVHSFISQNHEKVREAITTIVESRAVGLGEITKQDDTTGIVKTMVSIRDAVPNAVKTKTRSDWNSMTQNIRDSLAREGQDLLIKLKDRFTAEVSQWSAGESANIEMPDATTGVFSALIKTFKNSDTTISLASISEAFPFENIEVNTNSLQNSALGSYVKMSTDKRYKSERKKDCSSGFLGLSSHCVTYNQQVPYYVKVYSPVISSFKAAFDGIIPNWVTQYDTHVQSYLKDASREVAVSGKDKLNLMFNEPKKMVSELLESSREALRESSEKSQILEAKKNRLIDLVTKLRDLI